MLAQVLIGAIAIGCIYGLIALGFVMLYNGTGVIHFGYGDQATFSAYFVIIFMHYYGASAGLAMTGALALAALTGVLIYYLVMRPLATWSPLVQMMATLALGIGFREFMRAFMGPSSWPFPFLLSPVPFRFGSLTLVPANLGVVAAVMMILLALYLFFEHTRIGKGIIASCENRVGASLVGVRTSYVFLGVWVLSSVLACVAGILIAPILTLSPDLGLIAIKGFVAAVLGGFTLGGAVVGGIVLGILETLSGVYISTALKDFVTFSLLILALLLRPQGIFGAAALKKV